MGSPVKCMYITRYERGGKPLGTERVSRPSWAAVEEAIRRMDDFCHPIVVLSCSEYEEDETAFNIIGGDGRYVLFHIMGEWQYEDPAGGDGEVWLWRSDQGYFCEERNVCTDVEKALRIVRVYYDTGSYEGLDGVE